MRAFVTGATGFIGRRLVDQLVRDGDDVGVLARRADHDLPATVRVTIGCVDGDREVLARAMSRCDVVFHLAAKVSFDPRCVAELMRVNGEGTREVLAAARSASVGRTVVASSACTIGLSDRPEKLLDEDTPCDARSVERNPYMRSKCAAEASAMHASRDGQWVAIVNPTTVFGVGDRTLNSGTLVRQVARAAVLPVPPGGSNVIDVDDVVEGFLAAARLGRSGARYILGGVNLSYGEIFERVASVVGRRPLMVPLPGLARSPMVAAAWMVQRLTGSRLITPQIVADTFRYKFFSSRRAEAELGWRARRDFTSTLAAAWEYYRHEGLITLPAGATS